MDLIETLFQERKKAQAERAEAVKEFDEQIADIDAAILAIRSRRQTDLGKTTPSPNDLEARPVFYAKPSVDDAILEAVKNGVQAPADILSFVANQMNIDTTVKSIRTRVSRLGKQGRLDRDGRGWVLPSQKSGDNPQVENGEAVASPEAEGSNHPSDDSKQTLEDLLS